MFCFAVVLPYVSVVFLLLPLLLLSVYRRYPAKSVLGAGVILLGACVAMFLPISRLIEARSELDDATKSHEYEPDHLRGGSGDYAIVEGESRGRRLNVLFFFFTVSHGLFVVCFCAW